MINNSKSSTPHFTSKEALLSCKSYARVQLCLIKGIWGITAISENWVPVSVILYKFPF